ncbi:hypothetical protein [Henriciella algicola]|uniref:Uncharacterized protein n=1 Tax=Henriciella algicola TaxID=1608422 RepID=A0A399REG8_9PROT|nr:hypothetical protein [Henriciella algicola]RIJ29808.1 hypothetical protein D1222_08195 [Henriciella algicola]
MRHEDGYATASVLGLIAVLSLLSFSLMNLSLTELDRSRQAEALVKTRLALQGTLYQHVQADLERPDSFRLGTTSSTWDGISLEVRRSDDQKRFNLLRDTLSENKSGSARSLSPEVEALVNEAQRSDRDPSNWQLAYLKKPARLSDESWACIIDEVSFYRSTFNPIATERPQSLDGALVRYDVFTAEDQSPTLYLRAVILFTGAPERPIEIMDWSFPEHGPPTSCP